MFILLLRFGPTKSRTCELRLPLIVCIPSIKFDQNNTNNNFNEVKNQLTGGESTLAKIPTISPNENLLDFVYDIDEDCDLATIATISASRKNKELEVESCNSNCL